MRRPVLCRSALTISMTLITLVLASSLCSAQYSFTPLGDFAGGLFESSANAISADGTVVVGRATSASGTGAFRWTSVDGVVPLGALPGDNLSAAADSSVDGSVVVGVSGSPPGGQAFRWTKAGGIVGLGHLPGHTGSTGIAVSDDGSTIVGYNHNPREAFRWTAADGMVSLGFLPGRANDSVAWASSNDGSVVVGRSGVGADSQAFRWTADHGIVAIGYVPDSTTSQAFGVSPDGSVVVGVSGSKAFRWTQPDGMVSLGNLAGGPFNSSAHGVSADGSIIVGLSGTGSKSSENEAFFWTPATGMVNLQELLVDGGVTTLSGWNLEIAWDISADGRTIVGSGNNPNGFTEAWIATIPPIPEPSTWALAGCGLLCVALLWQKRRKGLRPPASGL